MTKLSTLRWAAKGEAGRGGGGSDCVVTPRRRRETESQPPRAAGRTAGRGRTVSSSRDRSAGGAQTHHPGPSCAVVLRPPTTGPESRGRHAARPQAPRRTPRHTGGAVCAQGGEEAERPPGGRGRRAESGACPRGAPGTPEEWGARPRCEDGAGQAAVACRPQGIQDQGQAILLPRWQTSNSPGCLR